MQIVSTAFRTAPHLLTVVRYKPEVKLRFVTEELAFESDEQCAAFILDYASKELFSDRDDGGVRLLTGKVGAAFEAAKAAAFKQVDIKGQI